MKLEFKRREKRERGVRRDRERYNRVGGEEVV